MSGVLQTIKSLQERQLEFLKAVTTGDFSTANVTELDFATMVEVYADINTPLAARLGRTESRDITHYWREAAVRAGTSNSLSEGGTPTARELIPARKSNTCQIISGLITVTSSAERAAEKGVYGDDLAGLVEWQAQQEIQGLLQDMEWQTLFGVESTSDARKFKGLAGTIQSWDGFVQTNRTTRSGSALNQATFDNFLRGIVDQKTGRFPTAIYCSNEHAKVISGWETTLNINVDITQLEQLRQAYLLTAGKAVGFYRTPWGVLDIIGHPLIGYDSGDAANNYMLALCEPLVRYAIFDPLKVKPVADTTALTTERKIWVELTLECRVEKAHGLFYNFT